MSGFVLFHRGLFDHPFFKPEPLTEREAWRWLIEEAAWKPTKVRIGGSTLELKRGELAHATRYLAKAWQWETTRVYRFLKRMERASMITTRAQREATHITICNYDKFQSLRNADETTPATQMQRECNKEEQDNNTSSNPQRRDLIHPKAGEVTLELESILGIDREFVPPQWCGAEMRISACLDQGWRPEIIISSVRRQASRGPSPPVNFKFYEKGIAEDHAKASAPVPQAKIIPAETIEVRRAAKVQSGTPQDAIRNILERVREGGIRPRADNADVRQLPPRRGE